MNPFFTRPRLRSENSISEFAKKLKASLQSRIESEGSVWVLIVDQNVARFSSLEGFKSQEIVVVQVRAGESLKTFEAVCKLANRVQKLTQKMGRNVFGFVAMGGGSVGDSVGLLASLWQRGRPIIHIPTTWLAAIDSSHGGKTAVNFAGAKNQFGTFWFPSEVWLVREFLSAQDIRFCIHKNRKQKMPSGGMGELMKMALLDQKFFKKFESIDVWNPNFQQIWNALPLAIEAKYRIVEKDPFESKKIRRVLNLGHTLGHVFEILLKLPHGEAVGLGLHFSLIWGVRRKISQPSLMEFAEKLSPLMSLKRKLIWKSVERLLSKDKKQEASKKIDFVFLKAIGKPIRTSVSLDEIRTELKNQGWV